MNQRSIKQAIYLSGIKSTGYTVHHAIDGEVFYCVVPSVSIGNAIVRALRERARSNDAQPWARDEAVPPFRYAGRLDY
jgi:hypothetical protein